MAITIVATPNAANANSYLTLADAQAIIDGFVQDADVTAWATATTDQKNRALFTATQRLDRERYLGARATDTQSLQWPRTGVRRPDTYINTYAVGFPFRISTDYFDDDEIPLRSSTRRPYLRRICTTTQMGLALADWKTTRTSKSAAST
jgi:hypothetical protein